MWLLDSLTDKKMNIHLKLDDSDIILYIKVIDNDKQISRMDIIKHNDENCLYIGDILRFSKNKYYNKGIGTMMMNELIDYAKMNNYHEIRGELSTVDNEHKDRLHHFYRKFGFEIINTNNRNDCVYATISKRI